MKGIKYIFLLVAVIFGGVGIGMFCGFIVPDMRAQNTVKNGTLATAAFVDYGSNTTVNGEAYYFIKFTYVNADGIQKEGKTASAYTYREVKEIEEVGQFEIKYIKNHVTALPYKKPAFYVGAWILSGVFGGVGIIMASVFVIAVKRDIGEGKIKSQGIDGVGSYLNHTCNVYINGRPIFKIHFTYTDQDGNYIETKTRSAYEYREANALAQMGEFPIKYIGKKVIISIDRKDLLRMAHEKLHNNQPEVPPNQQNNQDVFKGY